MIEFSDGIFLYGGTAREDFEYKVLEGKSIIQTIDVHAISKLNAFCTNFINSFFTF